MKKRSVYREHNQKFRKSSRYKKNILQAEIVKFTDDNDLILKLSQQDKIKNITEVLYAPKNKDPILKIGDTILVEITETPNDEYLLNAKFISTINDNRISNIPNQDFTLSKMSRSSGQRCPGFRAQAPAPGP